MRKLRYGLIFLLLGLVVLLLILLNIGAGTVSVSPSEIIRVLEGEGTSLAHKIVVEMRTPRALGAALIGALYPRHFLWRAPRGRGRHDHHAPAAAAA